MKDIYQEMRECGVIPVFNHAEADVALEVMKTCYQEGLRVFEFTNRNAEALSVFKILAGEAAKYPDLILGAGTVFTSEEAIAFVEAGASFIVSPIVNTDLASTCKIQRVPWVPGCGTVTEVYHAHLAGAELVKVFPGNVLGPAFVKSVKSVIPGVKLMPTGGVKPEKSNLEEWFSAGVWCVGMGSALFDAKRVKQPALLAEGIRAVKALADHLKADL